MLQYTFTILLILFAVSAVFSKYRRKKMMFYFTKPAATLVIILMLYFTKSESSVLYLPILFALIFSFFGDIFLMFEGKGFLYGIIAFLIAHIFYSLAFMQQVEIYNYYLLIPVFGITIGFYLYIVKYLEKFRRPVSIYISIITLMFWLAVNRFFFENSYQNTLVFSGAVLFVISDALLALNKFKTKFPLSELLILTTYYLAQYLFVMAV